MHCTENNKNDWRAEWGYQALLSCCTSKKAGVAILFNNNFTFQISKTYSDPEGRFIICDLTVNGKQLTLTNIYAPNNDDSNFLTSVLSHLADFKCDEIMIGSDFNLVLDVKKIKGVTLQELIKDHWKLSIAPLKRWKLRSDRRLESFKSWSSRFTWREKKPEIHCRLDFFLINQCTFCNIINAEILAGYKTDHSMITLQISFHSSTRGWGFWKLNTSFLSETEYVNQIKSIIAKSLKFSRQHCWSGPFMGDG